MKICKVCGRELPLSAFRERTVRGKGTWVEGKCLECAKAYDTAQKRARRQGEGKEAYNRYMRDYMRKRALEGK